MKKYLLLAASFCLTAFSISLHGQNSLAVTVFHDLSGNGLHDGAEGSIAGIPTTDLRLWQDIDNSGTITGGDLEWMHDSGPGVYTFGAGGLLLDDNYILEYVEAGGPGNYYVTKLIGVADLDNDLDPMTNNTGLFALSGGGTETSIDLGLVIASNIGNFVWQDNDGDGVQDGGEPGINGVSVTLLDALTMTPIANNIDFLPLTNPAVTAAGGIYTFANIVPGDYIVQFSLPAPSPDPWYPTVSLLETDATDMANDSDADIITLKSHTVILQSNEVENDIDAGFFQASKIGDLVWEDLNGNGTQDGGEPGINGVTVTLLDNLGAPAIGATGVVVPDQVTAGGGIYQFTLVKPGSYQVQFSLPPPFGGIAWYPTAFTVHTDANDPADDSDANNVLGANYLKSHVITTLSGETAEELRIDAGFWVPAKVGDKVFCDENGNGIDDDGVGGVPGMDVRLITPGGATALDANGANLTTVTDAAGMYMFQLVPPGMYRVEFSFTASTPAPPFTFTIPNEPSATDFTDSDAAPNGQTDLFTVLSKDTDEELKWDAGVYQTITVSGTVWLEDDMNNINNGEMGPTGVLIELYNTDGSKFGDELTNAGAYEFTGVPPGDYYIQFNVAGTTLESASPCPGSNDANDMVDNDDNGPDNPIVITTVFTLLSNCDKTNPPTVNYIDFCYFFDCNMPNPLASTACSQITPANVICEITTLGTFCNVMPTGNSPGDQPEPLCPDGGQVHNVSWFAFVAYGGTYTVTVTPTNCTGGQPGVQLGLYTDCTFTETVYCDPGCSTNPVSFNSDLLEEGQVYYFFIDGCAGSVCSYEVDITGNPIAPDLSPDDMCINSPAGLVCADATFCPDTDVVFEATGIDLTVDFTWSVTTLSGIPYSGNPNPMTEEEMLPISFPDEGVYVVCLELIDNGCQIWNAGICRTVTIEGIDDEEFDEQIICEEDLATFDLGVFDPDDPNTDGTMGWQVTGTTPDFGIVMGTVVTADGCMYDQQFELMMYPNSDKGLFEQTLCKEDLPITIDAQMISVASFGGQLTFTLNDLLLQNEVNQYGCDTSIDISLEILDIFGGQLTQGLCLPEGVIMNFMYDPSLSTDEQYITYEWFDPSGNVLVDGWNVLDPLDNLAPTSIGSGDYTVTVTITKNGTTCTFDFIIPIDFSLLLPPDPDISGPGLAVCESDSIVTYTAINGGDAFSFDWSFPSDVASSTISGANGQILTINWSGSAGGSVSVIGENGCGFSEEIEIIITVIPQASPAFGFTTEVCQDSSATIEFSGDASTIDTYTWDFDGGTENNGTGMVGPGPHLVSWPDSGSHTVTLSVLDVDGCTSLITSEDVMVVAPLAPPVINCNPNTGEVSFTWPDVTGATGYDVVVTSTSIVTGMLHEGTLNGTTYTVMNLEDGETATIILTVYSGDACVKIEVTSPGCTSQNCVAPTITLAADTLTFCLDQNSGVSTITSTITSGETGTGIFSGPGIIDPINGVFDPDSANIGMNTITYVFMTDDFVPCIGNQTIQIEVKQTPMASFTTGVDTICILDAVILTYDGTSAVNTLNWNYGPGGTGTGGQMPSVTFNSPGLKTISLDVTKNGCTSELATREVFVEPELIPVTVTCLQQDINFVEFGWNAVAGATGYVVTVGANPPFNTTGTSHMESGLTPGDIVTITVTVLSDSKCPGSSFTQDCEAKACPQFTFNYPTPVTSICDDGNVPLIDLLAIATGGDETGTYTWTGSPNIVNGNQFNPNGLPEGSYSLFVTYEENSCEADGSVLVNITTTPSADFDTDATTICIGSTVNLLYTGSQLPNQSITWNSTGGTVTPGAGANEYSATFNQAGTFDIILNVENGTCTTPDASATIVVEPELIFDMIDCQEELDQIAFSWTAVDCATEYEVFVGGVSQGIQTTTEFIVTGLAENEEVMLEVIAVSGCACGNVMQTRMCQSKACTQVALSLSAMGGITEFCFADDLAPVEIIAEALGTDGNGTATWSGPGVSVDGIFDPVAAGIGTHTIVYDFLESAGCPYVESIEFIVNDVPSVSQQFDPITCYDQTNTMLEVIPAGGDGNYTITLNGVAGQLMNDVEAGTYTILVTDGNLCTAETSVTITVPNEPQPSISGALVLTVGESSDYSIPSQIFGNVSIDSIVWTANGTVVCNDSGCFILQNQFPDVATDYEVTVYYNDGCSVTTSIRVDVLEPEPITKFEHPNIISPNGDGKNDVWKFFSNNESVIINTIAVFDRWGNKVFGFDGPATSAKDNNITWDGKFNNKDLQPGVYVFYVDYDDENGRLNRIKSGDITIVK